VGADHILPTAAAGLAIVQDAHTRIKEAANARLVAIVGPRVCDFNNGALLNLIRAEDPELDTNHWLDIRIWTVNSCGHLSTVLERGF
jgi:hypothetical protein